MRYLVNICYDGSLFYGFESQPNKRTISSTIENELQKILNEKIKIVGCSRTDKGVHANNYFFHFDTTKDIEIEKLQRSLNKLLPKDIYVKNIKEVDEYFHARYSVVNKEYKYIINTGIYNPTKRNIELQYGKPIDLQLMKEASNYLLGTHDFKSFTSDNEKDNYVRTINYINIKQNENIIEIYINGDGFLKYMIRNIVGLFLEINEGKKKINDIPDIINSKDRRKLGVKAPSNGLYLNIINY